MGYNLLKNRRLIVNNKQIDLVTHSLEDSPIIGHHLVKIVASGLNRADLLQRQGLYPIGENEGLGLELSGYNIQTGEPLCALVTCDAHSDFIQIDQSLIMPIPEGTDMIAAAALPEALLTCWLNLFELGRLQAGESILIHGGSSGIGSIAIQIAKCFGAKVYTTVGDDNKMQNCAKLGADYVFNYKRKNYSQHIKELGGCDLILDILGGSETNNNIAALNKYGRIVMIAVMKGGRAEVNLGNILIKNLRLYGSTLRSKTVDEKKLLIDAVVKNLYPLIESGAIKPVVDSIYSLENHQAAFARMESREHFGKIILIRD